MTQVHVVGAGLSGLATAWFLHQGGARVHVLEAAGSAGGLIQTLRTKEGLVETAAPAFTSSDRVLALFSSAGVDACVPDPAMAKRYVFRGGRARRWPLTPVESAATLQRFGRAWIRRRHRPLEDERLGDWGRRVLGPAGLDWLVAPSAQIYGASPDALSAAAVLRGRRRGDTRVAPRRGMQDVIDRLVETLHARGVRFTFGERLSAIDPAVPTAICTGAPAAAALLAPRAPLVAAALERIGMVSLATVTAFFQPTPGDLRGFGVLFPRSQGVDALGVLFNSDMFPGRSQLRSETWIYGDGLCRALASGVLDEEDLRRRVAADRGVLTGRADRPVAVYITPRPNALPLYDAALLDAARAAQALPPAIALAGNYLGALGVSRLVDGGAAAAARLLRVTSGSA